MPTGGVTLDNAGDWIRAGAVAVGVGSALLDAKAIEEGRLDVLDEQRAPHRRERRLRKVVMPTMPARVVVVRRNHAAAQPAGVRAAASSRRCCRRTFGGGEANVAVSLAQFGLESHYVTRLPGARDRRRRDPRAARRRRRHRVTSSRGGSRVGIYFAETGASQRAVHRHLRPRAFGDQRDPARRRRLGSR